MGASIQHGPVASGSVVAQPRSLLVLGLGNSLLGDDGTGPKIVQHLRETSELPAGTTLMDGGTLSFSLLADIEDADGLIAVDAAQLGESPGTVCLFEGEAMDHFLRDHKGSSVHEVSLAELLDMARLTRNLPERRALVAIQPDHIDWNTELSPAVNLGLQVACSRIRELLVEWST